MTAIQYVTLVVFLLSNSSNAQSNVAGLGQYVIGVTTPDSLQRTDFQEEGQSYIKGTIALPCTHIRTFKLSSVDVEGIAVVNLSLAFYDNTLFRISCDYSDSLSETFILKHGKGVSRPKRSFLVCASRKDKPIIVWGEAWQNGDILAFVVHNQGYNADCLMQEGARLVILSQRFKALSSDCELINTDQYVEEY